MMRAIAILSVSGLILAAGGTVVVIGLSVAHAQAPSGKVLEALVARWLSRGRLVRLGNLRRRSIV